MNIQFQFCGLFLLLLLLVFYKSHKTLQLYKEKIFYNALCVMIMSLVFDIFSLVVIQDRDVLSDYFVNFMCKTYIVSLVWVVRSALIYVMTDLYNEAKHRVIARFFFGIAVIQSIVVYLLPIYIFDNSDIVYTYGSSVYLVYAFAVLYIFATLIIAIAFYKRLNSRRAFAVIIWMIIWSGSAILQYLYSGLLIVGFAGAIGVMILFVIIENPEANLDRALGCFNSYAMAGYITKLIDYKESFSVLEITFEHSEAIKDSDMNADDIMRQILRMVKPYKEIYVFKKRSLGFVMVSKNKEWLEVVGKEISIFITDVKAFQEKVTLILMNRADSLGNVDNLLRFLYFVRSEYADQNGKLYEVSEKAIQKYGKQHMIEKEIEAALEEDRVEVFLQPIYSNRKNRFTSAEALVRIRQRTGEFLSPGVFIPVAEESGQILELGERVFEKVCDFLENSNVVQLGIEYIEVNLSVIQCEQKDLAARLIEIADRYKIEPRMINLEITETASISARTILLKNMKLLMDRGFTFSLDDFGKGESNLMYVVEMPVSIVKLDYDMTKAFFDSEKAKHVVRAVVNMAHDMGIKLVAEGIETKEEIDGMYQEQIDYIQGYYYSKPLPMTEVLLFFEKNNKK